MSWQAAPFSRCLNCGEFHTAREREFSKLASISSEARSIATTVLATSLLRNSGEPGGPRDKLLRFTDSPSPLARGVRPASKSSFWSSQISNAFSPSNDVKKLRKVAVLEEHVKRATAILTKTHNRWEAKFVHESEVLDANANLLDIKIRLLQERAKIKAPTK